LKSQTYINNLKRYTKGGGKSYKTKEATKATEQGNKRCIRKVNKRKITDPHAKAKNSSTKGKRTTSTQDTPTPETESSREAIKTRPTQKQTGETRRSRALENQKNTNKQRNSPENRTIK
jgi:hypothetical protein